MTVSIIIPTFNGELYIRALIDRLLKQTVPVEIVFVDSGSTDCTDNIISEYCAYVKYLKVLPKCFDHGGTRDYALRHCTGDFICFLTQDALPINNQYIENILKPFSESSVAAVCGRQIARDDAPEYEKLTREFNYPKESRIWSEKDIGKYGVKSYFFSDACSAYRRSAYEAVGGFDTPIITNEDMMIAGKFLHAGYSLCYNADAAVYHSHHFTLKQEYDRNIKIGYVMEQYRNRLIGAKADNEGIKMTVFVMGQLLKRRKVIAVIEYTAIMFAKFFGNRKGKRQFKTRK